MINWDNKDINEQESLGDDLKPRKAQHLMLPLGEFWITLVGQISFLTFRTTHLI